MIKIESQDSQVRELDAIIDTYRVLDEFGVKYISTDRDTVLISEEDFQKMLDGSANKKYVMNLLHGRGRMHGPKISLAGK